MFCDWDGLWDGKVEQQLADIENDAISPEVPSAYSTLGAGAMPTLSENSNELYSSVDEAIRRRRISTTYMAYVAPLDHAPATHKLAGLRQGRRCPQHFRLANYRVAFLFVCRSIHDDSESSYSDDGLSDSDFDCTDMNQLVTGKSVADDATGVHMEDQQMSLTATAAASTHLALHQDQQDEHGAASGRLRKKKAHGGRAKTHSPRKKAPGGRRQGESRELKARKRLRQQQRRHQRQQRLEQQRHEQEMLIWKTARANATFELQNSSARQKQRSTAPVKPPTKKEKGSATTAQSRIAHVISRLNDLRQRI